VHATSRKWPARETKYSHTHTYRMIIEFIINENDVIDYDTGLLVRNGLRVNKKTSVDDPDPVGSASFSRS
jgi:hypothetical protein